MKLYIIFLILLTLLIIYFLFFNKKNIEGLDTNDPLYISKITASDIISIGKELNELDGMNEQISNVEKKINLTEEGIQLLRNREKEKKRKREIETEKNMKGK